MYKLLFVDDNELNREVLAEMLKILFDDIVVDTYEQASDVLALDIDRYDLILSDINMPEINGFELFTKLKEKQYKKPIIAVTALAVAGDRERILLYGFNDYISKPISIDELENVIKKYI
jgi:CheY-like chemotaxis protein